MIPNNPDSETIFSGRILPAIEPDCTDGHPIDPSLRQPVEFCSPTLQPVELNMAVPHLVLSLRLSEKVDTENTELLALDVLNLLTALSEYEKTLGGCGLRSHDKTADVSAMTINLAPILVINAAERLNQIAELLGKLPATAGKPKNTGKAVLDALAHLEQSAVSQCKAAFSRRKWEIEAKIALPG
jgi:hypothetical protein